MTIKDDLKAVLDAIEGINDRLNKLEQSKVEVKETPKEIPTFVGESKFPIPVEFRNIVDTVLNKKFGVDIDYLPDSASFSFSVLVPKEYSNAGQPHWETYHEDRRTKVIVNALGVNGVRDWCNQIYDNFGPEMKSKITYERTLPQ